MNVHQITNLFFLVVFASFLELAAQYFWIKNYFIYGIPLARISDLEFENLKKRKGIKHAEKDGFILIRQKYYSLSLYSYFHGFIKMDNNGMRNGVIFMDYNVPLVAIFWIESIFSLGWKSFIAGFFLSWLICLYCLQPLRNE